MKRRAEVRSPLNRSSFSRREFLKSSAMTAALPAFARGELATTAGAKGRDETRMANSCDVLVYGATASGVLAAIACAKEGAKVFLLEPRKHVGGMVSGGLSQTDMERQGNLIGGLAGEFFSRVAQHYHRSWSPASSHADEWTFEPHVAENIFTAWLKEAGVPVFFKHRVEAVRKDKNHIVSLTVGSGAVFNARVYIDASYEGDLMARAGADYTVGREGRGEFGESLAGRREVGPFDGGRIDAPVPAYDDAGKLLPLMTAGDAGVPGQGDHKVQAYNLRVCLTNRDDNQVPFTAPLNYDPHQYILAALVWQTLDRQGNKPHFSHSAIPNAKFDFNTGWGGVDSNFVGANWAYPDADYDNRQEIWDAHYNYVKGFYYFLANDPSVPPRWREEIRKYGLAKDEFVDTEHWPHQLYVREARRMRGEYVMTQSDLQENRTKYDSIGMGGYNMDMMPVQRIPILISKFPTGTRYIAINEGYLSVPVEPYQIPYRALLPLYHECSNLIVSVCVSATKVAYGSLRMESQYMLMGHAAGVAAAEAATGEIPVQRVDIRSLQRKLQSQGQVLSSDYLAPVVNLRRFRE
jgi:FAD dependent oxidoreductase